MNGKITRFSASGILSRTNYTLNIDGHAAIIVGPNGTGKSTFLSLFYLFLSRQWVRLSEYDFSVLTLEHSNGYISLSKADILGSDLRSSHPPSIVRIVDKLNNADLLGMLYKTSLSKEDREKIAQAVGISTIQVASVRRLVLAEFGTSRQVYEADRGIQSLDLGPIIYLPTYRRIEKDIKSIFPDIESRIRSKMEESGMSARSGAGFKEIAGFGMADVSEIISQY